MPYQEAVASYKMAAQPFYRENPFDPELEHKARRVSDKLSETVNVIANEPSLAFFRIQEHVRKSLPQLVDQKHEVEDIQARVQGACFDAEYANNAVRAMQASAIHFQNIQDLLKNAMFMKQQINYEDSRRKCGKPSPSAAPVPGEKGKQPEVGREDSSNALLESGQVTDGTQTQAENQPKKSLEDSDDSGEVAMFLSGS